MTEAGDVAVDAVERYEAAKHRAVFAREEWESAGTPLTIEYVNGLVGVHPSLKALQDAESHADKLMKSLVKKRSGAVGGRPVGAASAVDRVSPSPSKRSGLRAVS